MTTRATSASDFESAQREERRIMDAYAPVYRTSLLFSSPMYRRERRRFAEWMLKRIGRAGERPEALRFLDVGCGTGEILEHLGRAGCRRLTGLDMTDAMLDQARVHVSSDTRLVLGTVESEPFGDERFDVVLSALSVHHLHDPAAFFRFTHRVLAPGGRFYILEYNGGSPSHRRAFKRTMNTLAAPVRSLVKLKNRGVLRTLPDPRRHFNPSHQLLSWEALREAMVSPGAYELHRTTHGFLLATFNFAFVSETGADGVLIRIIDAAGAFAQPLGCGYFQWIEGRKLPG